MEKTIKQPAYVKELFEKDFINKWTCYIVNPEKCYKKYKINKEKIEGLVYELSNKALGNDYVKSYWKKTKGLSEEEKEFAYEQWVDDRKNLIEHLKTHKYYIKQNKSKYYFIDFLEQVLYRIAEVENRDFYTEQDILLQYNKFFSISLDVNFKQDYKMGVVNLKQIILPSKTPSGSLKYEVENINQIYLKAFKYYANKVFNLKLHDFLKEYDKNLTGTDIDIVEKVIEIINYKTKDFKNQYLQNMNDFIKFALFESFNVSIQNKSLYTHEYLKTIDHDYQKKDLYDNTFKKLLSLKENIYKQKANLNEKRAGGAKQNVSKRILNQYGENILMHAAFIKSLRDDNLMGQFRKGEIEKDKYLLLKSYYEMATEKSNQLNKFKSIGDYLKKENYKKLAIALFIMQNNIPILANTLYARFLKTYTS